MNSSLEVLKELQKNSYHRKIHFQVLPVSFMDSWNLLSQEMQKLRPTALLLLGQARGRDKVNLERLAINLIDCDIADNQGNLFREKAISEGKESALFCKVNLDSLLQNLEGLPVKKSFSAGAYVCNYLYFKTLEALKNEKAEALFVHLPILPEQSKDGTASLDLKVQVATVQKILEFFC